MNGEDERKTVEFSILPAQLAARSFGLTDRGQVRENNEDQFLIATLVKALHIQQTSLPQPQTRRSSDRSYLYVVADGMGGEAAGEEASALALDSVERYILEALQWFGDCPGDQDDQVLAEFRKALSIAHQLVRAEAAEYPALSGMGTTLTLAYSLNEVLFLAHVGDSRCYLLREGVLNRLTRDHTLVEEMVRRGAITAEEAAHHRLRHVITSTVGGDSPNIRIDVHRLQLQADDVVLLCSDGLSGMLDGDQIREVLMAERDPEAACRRLVVLANEAGGNDNITVVVVRFESEAMG